MLYMLPGSRLHVTTSCDNSWFRARDLVLGDAHKTGKQTVLWVTDDGEKHPICDDGFTDLEATLICQKTFIVPQYARGWRARATTRKRFSGTNWSCFRDWETFVLESGQYPGRYQVTHFLLCHNNTGCPRQWSAEASVWTEDRPSDSASAKMEKLTEGLAEDKKIWISAYNLIQLVGRIFTENELDVNLVSIGPMILIFLWITC